MQTFAKYGDFYAAYSHPPLTTIGHQYPVMGTRAAALMMDLLHGGAGEREVIEPAFLQRGSVAAIQRPDTQYLPMEELK